MNPAVEHVGGGAWGGRDDDDENRIDVIRRPRRPWLRRLAVGVAGLLAWVLAVYGWAWLSLDRSAAARAMLWREADVGDQFRFPARVIPAGAVASPLPRGVEIDPSAPPAEMGEDIDGFLSDTELLALSGPRNPNPGDLGVVREGAHADLLLVDGDPLPDLSLIATPETSLSVIMKNGVIVKNTPT